MTDRPAATCRALLLEDVASPGDVAEALFASISGNVPLVVALTETGAVSHETLARYFARSDAPFLRQVVPLMEVCEKLPPGLCARLFAVPVRRDAITGTVDVVVADPTDLHPGREIAFHLQVPVRLVRGPTYAIDEALRRMRMRASKVPPPSRPPGSRPPTSSRMRPPAPPIPPFAPPTPSRHERDDEHIYDSRPRAIEHERLPHDTVPPAPGSVTNPSVVFPPIAPCEREDGALRPSRVPDVGRVVHVAPSPVPAPTDPPLAPLHAHGARRGRPTPPWGTPVHNAGPPSTGSDPPKSNLGSEIPIPLTRRTFTAVAGGTQRPPPMLNPADSPLGEGIPVDAAALRPALEVRRDDGMPHIPEPARVPMQMQSFIPGPPPVPGGGPFAAFAPQTPFADIGGIMSALRAAGSRDEVLELVLTAARMVAFKVALFVVKRGGYLGWACTPEFGDRSALQHVLVPLEQPSVFDQAVREGLYLGPIRNDDVHTMLLHVMRSATRDVAVVPIRVSGKTAVIIVADELGDTMLATRRLEELARAAGDAFARIVRMRR